MNILLCISGGIAAYKTPQLIRDLQRTGHIVSVAATPAALKFVSELSLNSLLDSNIIVDIFNSEHEGISHIQFADWADLVVVAPATANTLAKLANGLADNAVSVSYLAATCPKILFPAMNSNMWQAAATQQNIEKLKQHGAIVVDPTDGELACGWTGPGRMPDLEDIVDIVNRQTTSAPNFHQLKDKHVLITAGPTREYIDPVRFLSNPSTGKMGYALAQAALSAGADVTLVSGPTNLTAPSGMTCINVVSAQQMYDGVLDAIAQQNPDIFIAAAAVADYTPKHPADKKLKKESPLTEISTVATKDILADVSRTCNIPVVVGFAAETDDTIANARKKLDKKSLTFVVANQVGGDDTGFAADTNEVWLIDSNSEIAIPKNSKLEIARQIILRAATYL